MVLLGAINACLANTKQILAQFELATELQDTGAAAKTLNKTITFYRSPLGATPFEEFVEVVAKTGSETKGHFLSRSLAGRLLSAFDESMLTPIDFQSYFDRLQAAPAKAQRGLVQVGKEGEISLVAVYLRTKKSEIRFRVKNPELLFYSHTDDGVANDVYKLIEACAATLGLENLLP